MSRMIYKVTKGTSVVIFHVQNGIINILLLTQLNANSQGLSTTASFSLSSCGLREILGTSLRGSS